MKGLVKHRWAVGAAALVLVFMLGAVSWAATQGTERDAGSDSALGAPGLGMFGPAGDGPGGDLLGFGPKGGRGMRGGEITDEMKAQMEERRAAMEERRDAFLDLVREKMSAEDQAALDSLLKTAETQRQALEAARDALHGTTDGIHDLVSKYFPTDPAVSGDATGDATGETTGLTEPGI
jgi:hypothetical protein